MLPLGLTALLSAFAPLVIRVIKRYIATPQLRTLIAWALSGVTGVVAAVWFGYDPTWDTLIPFILAAHAGSQIAWATWRGLAG
jgi:hypothetical protein